MSLFLVHVVLMSRKFDDFERLLPIRKRNVLTPVQNQEFYRAKNKPGTSDYDYEYDYDLVDRAPGYDVYNFKDGDREGKLDSQCSEVAESQFETVYKNSCNIIFEKSCKIEYVQSDPGRKIMGKCALKYETKCSTFERTHQKGKSNMLKRLV